MVEVLRCRLCGAEHAVGGRHVLGRLIDLPDRIRFVPEPAAEDWERAYQRGYQAGMAYERRRRSLLAGERGPGRPRREAGPSEVAAVAGEDLAAKGASDAGTT
jgi:hypothetical protein